MLGAHGVQEEERREEAAVAGSVATGGTVPVPQCTGRLHITTPQVTGHPAREPEPHWAHFTDGNREAQRDSAAHSRVRAAGLACGGGEVADFPEKSRPCGRWAWAPPGGWRPRCGPLALGGLPLWEGAVPLGRAPLPPSLQRS